MLKNMKIDIKEMDSRLNNWLAKVDPCYKQEVEQSMNNFRKEIGITINQNEK